MRCLVAAFFVLLLAGCNKNQRIIRKIEGTWTMTKFLQNDGSEIYPVKTFYFGEGDADNYNDWTVYTPTDTLTGSYKVYQKGAKIVLKSALQTDSCTIEDHDKEMLIIRQPSGVIFLER